MDWGVHFTEEAAKMLLPNEDRGIRKLLKERAMRMSLHPDLQGKPLGGDLAGLRSTRAMGQRYRMVYELFPEDHEVWVVTVGLRRGIRSPAWQIHDPPG